MEDTAAAPALWGVEEGGPSAGAVSGGPQLHFHSLAAGAAAQGLTHQLMTAEDALTTTQSLVRKLEHFDYEL